MKKVFLSLLVVFMALGVQSQSYVVTPDGLRDSKDQSKDYLILECEGLTASQIYNNAIKYINENYKSPEDVIKAKSEGEYFRFETYAPAFMNYKNSGIVNVPIDATYMTELRFKNGKVRFEIIDLVMRNPEYNNDMLFSGGAMSGYIIFNRKGKLKKPQEKSDLEEYFNYQVKKLSDYLNGGSTTDDNW